MKVGTEMTNKTFGKRKCKMCGEVFNKSKPLQFCCCPACALEYIKKQNAIKQEKALAQARRKERALITSRKRQLKTVSEVANEVQKYCNRYIKLRDWGKPCISCGAPFKDNFHACHYVPRGRSSKLRFEPDNIHGGCVKCNTYDSGNLRGYRIGLIERIGEERVIQLETDHEIKRWTKEELYELKEYFNGLIKNMEGKN